MFECRQIFEFNIVRPLLEKNGLQVQELPDYTVGLYQGDRLAATGSLRGNVVMALAVEAEYQGEGLLGTVMGNLMDRAQLCGISHLFLYTKPKYRTQMEALGFSFLAKAEDSAILLETGYPDLAMWLHRVKKGLPEPRGRRGCIVMNGNPPTLGHLHLIEQAAAACDQLLVFVVETDQSAYSFRERYDTLQELCRGKENVFPVPSGPYIISSATFPGYFLKQAAYARAQTMLDIDMFCRRIVPAFGITARYVGEEPLCEVTDLYNRTMRQELPRSGVEFCCIPRFSLAGEPVSATRVRALAAEGRWEEIARLVPPETLCMMRRHADP